MSVKFSVVVPCYNAGELLEEALASLERQTCKDFEVVLIDDGSSDDTLARLRDYEKRASVDAIAIAKENGGVSAARNDGIRRARGEYILFLDADDVYHKDFIRLMAEGARSGADVAYCRLSRNLREATTCDVDSVAFQTQDARPALEKLLYEMGSYGFYCYAYRRERLDEIGLRFDEQTRYGEDREFVWKYASRCRTFAWFDAPLYGYRDTPGSVLKQTPYERTRCLEAIRRTDRYLRENGCDFADEYWGYMYPRSSWSLMKNFAINGGKESFFRAAKELDIKDSMKTLKNAPVFYIRALAKCYLISPTLFYYVVALIGALKK